MQVYHVGLHQIPDNLQAITACIGYFDGIHLGHQELIQRVVTLSTKNHTIPSLITFEPDPWVIIKKTEALPHITSMQDRMDIAEQLGIKNWYILDFDETMANISVEDFHDEILYPLHIHTLVCGFDFHYAKMGKGSITTLQAQHGFHVEVIEKIMLHDEKISSSTIEALIEDGEVEEARTLLSRPYFVKGTIVHGNHIGRTYGFPTANLKLADKYIYPKKGVYIGGVMVHGKRYEAIINVGNNPSFNYRVDAVMEAHLLDFHDFIYDEHVTFYFYRRIRDEKKFEGKEALAKQLVLDQQTARLYFERKKDEL